MGSFEERLAAARATYAAKRDAQDEARSQAAWLIADAQARALEMKPAVEEAIAMVAALPLDPPYRLKESGWKCHRRDAVLEVWGRYAVYSIEEFTKPRIGKTGTVTPIGWLFSIATGMTGLNIKIRKQWPSTFWVSTPARAFHSQEFSLDELCSLGLISWNGGTFKDSTWLGETVMVHHSLDTFLDVAAELVSVRER